MPAGVLSQKAELGAEIFSEEWWEQLWTVVKDIKQQCQPLLLQQTKLAVPPQESKMWAWEELQKSKLQKYILRIKHETDYKYCSAAPLFKKLLWVCATQKPRVLNNNHAGYCFALENCLWIRNSPSALLILCLLLLRVLVRSPDLFSLLLYGFPEAIGQIFNNSNRFFKSSMLTEVFHTYSDMRETWFLLRRSSEALE